MILFFILQKWAKSCINLPLNFATQWLLMYRSTLEQLLEPAHWCCTKVWFISEWWKMKSFCLDLTQILFNDLILLNVSFNYISYFISQCHKHQIVWCQISRFRSQSAVFVKFGTWLYDVCKIVIIDEKHERGLRLKHVTVKQVVTKFCSLKDEDIGAAMKCSDDNI